MNVTIHGIPIKDVELECNQNGKTYVYFEWDAITGNDRETFASKYQVPIFFHPNKCKSYIYIDDTAIQRVDCKGNRVACECGSDKLGSDRHSWYCPKGAADVG